MTKRRWMGTMLGALVALAGCGGGASNELPEDFRGTFEMTRLLGTDNAMLTVGPTGITMAGCDINCPAPTLTFTSVTCPESDTCNVVGPQCTGTIELWRTSGRSLEITLTPVPGATGEAETARQVDCYQYSGSTESAS
jgi:hypothetical protein